MLELLANSKLVLNYMRIFLFGFGVVIIFNQATNVLHNRSKYEYPNEFKIIKRNILSWVFVGAVFIILGLKSFTM